MSRRRSNSRPPHIATVPRSSTPWPRTAFSLMRVPKANVFARFELACGRGSWRSLDSLRKIRQATKSPLSVVHCPSPVAGSPTEVLDEPESTNEPTAGREIATNEPTEGPLSVVRCPLPVADCPTERSTNPKVRTKNPPRLAKTHTNEPTELEENVASDPVSGPLSLDRSPLPSATWGLEAVDEPTAPNEPTREGRRNEDGGRKEAPNEPTAACENVTNEPTREGRRNEDGGRKDARTNPPRSAKTQQTNPRRLGKTWRTILPVIRCHWSLLLCQVSLGALKRSTSPMANEPATIQNSTNEPTGAGENVTNEPTGAERMPATLEGAIARIRRRREELVRASNEKERRKPRSIVGHGSVHGHTLSAILS